VTWRRLGLRITFTTLGGFVHSSDNACNAPGQVYVDVAFVTGKDWRTFAGLRMGDPAAHLKELYPRARRVSSLDGRTGDIRILVPGDPRCAVPCEPRLAARLVNGRVVEFIVPVHGQGE
jgi:hypothetical protein